MKRLALLLMAACVWAQGPDYNSVRNGPYVSATGTPYFARCNGTNNDTAAIQAAINAVGNGTLVLPASKCVIASPGLVLLPANAGMTMTAAGATPATAGVTQQGGLIASSSSPPTAILTIEAQNVSLSNIYLDCNSRAATNGLLAVSAGGGKGSWTGVTAYNCAGDGVVVNQYAGTTTSITSGGGAGSSAITVSNVSPGGWTFGGLNCGAAVFGAGTGNQEAYVISSVAGSVIHITGTLTHNQTTAVCDGNNNELNVLNLSANLNSGWGWHVVYGTDENAMFMSNPNFTSNVTGDELWEGGLEFVHIGGNYEGSTGYPIQLGTTTHASGTGYAYIGQLGDLEEASAQYDTINVVCDLLSNVVTQYPETNAGGTGRVTIRTGSDACSTYSTYGSATMVNGTFEDQLGYPSFFLKNTFASIPLTPGSVAQTTGSSCQYPGQVVFLPVGQQSCLQTATGSITAVTNANPAVMTTTTAPGSGYVSITGFTGTCEGLNGFWTGTNVSGTTFSIPTQGCASLSGSPIFKTAAYGAAPAPACITTDAANDGINSCGASTAGIVTISSGLFYLEINTSSVSATSQVFLTPDVGTYSALGITCNASPALTFRKTGNQSGVLTQFYIVGGATSGNKSCYDFLIVN